MERERCAFCGAMNPVDAEWCGMCLRRFPPPEVTVDPIESPADILLSDEPATGTTVGSESSADVATGSAEAPERRPKERGAFTVTESGISWTCPNCENKNPLDAQFCAVCGTPFAQVVSPKVERPERDPNTAALLSLLFPGAGHAYVGLVGQALARAIISLWVVSVVVISLVAGGEANSRVLAIVFGVVATLLWLVTAHDAYREARKETAFVILKGKFFLYLVLGLLMLLFALLVGAGIQANT